MYMCPFVFFYWRGESEGRSPRIIRKWRGRGRLGGGCPQSECREVWGAAIDTVGLGRAVNVDFQGCVKHLELSFYVRVSG